MPGLGDWVWTDGTNLTTHSYDMLLRCACCRWCCPTNLTGVQKCEGKSRAARVYLCCLSCTCMTCMTRKSILCVTEHQIRGSSSLKHLRICLVSINYSLSWLMPLCGSVSWLGALGGSRAEATPCNDDSRWRPSWHFYFFPLHFQSANVPSVRESHKRINLLWLRLDIRSNILWKAAETWVLTDQMGRGRRDLVVEFQLTVCESVVWKLLSAKPYVYICIHICFFYLIFFFKALRQVCLR